MLRVLIVDDTDTYRTLLRHIINATPDMRVIGEAHDGQQAVDMVSSLQPDIILMDITMPKMNGMDATQEIMFKRPTPIVMISASVEGRENEVAFQAMKLGALTLLSKPVGPGHPDYHEQVDNLVRTVRTLSGVQVIHHRTPQPKPRNNLDVVDPETIELIAIGSSTGGPAALSEIIRRLPGDFPYPIVIAQHIAQDFIPSLRQWLSGLTTLTITTAKEGETPESGHIYLAPGQANLTITLNRRFSIDTAPMTRYTPSCDMLFTSVARVYRGRAIGIILTGMGNDGAAGLKHMAETGALTIAQEESSCAVFGMPKEAIEQKAARRIATPVEIADILSSLAEDFKGA